MRFTVTFLESIYADLVAHLFQDRSCERAAYALCRVSETDNETRLLVRKIIPVTGDDVIAASQTDIRIRNLSFLRAMKIAAETKCVFLFIHSHPQGYLKHSKQDDQQEFDLFKLAYNRIPTKGVHGSIVLSDPDQPFGRIWTREGSTEPISLIRVIGNAYRLFLNSEAPAIPQFFDRQVRAFGEEIQRVLSQMHVGIIGAGGTGSSIIEQLTRLGVGKLTICDGQEFEDSNVNRVYGSTAGDGGITKTYIAQRNIEHIGLGTAIRLMDKPITYRKIASEFRECDAIFGCTDDHWGRSILNRLAVYYGIPVFDMGVRIDSENDKIQSIQGRVTTLLPGNACLFCRDRINSKRIEAESLSELDPSRLEALQKEGYADELPGTAPAVVPFTTNIAALAISEFLHRLTGFMGTDRVTNEIIMMFDRTEIRRNSRASSENCFCGDAYNTLRGDTEPLLDLTWRKDEEI